MEREFGTFTKVTAAINDMAGAAAASLSAEMFPSANMLPFSCILMGLMHLKPDLQRLQAENQKC